MFLSLKLSNAVLNFVHIYKFIVHRVFYFDYTLASDPDFSKRHKKDSENRNVT